MELLLAMRTTPVRGLTELERLIISILLRKKLSLPFIRIYVMDQDMKVHERTVRNALERLRKRGLVWRIRKGPDVKWTVTPLRVVVRASGIPIVGLWDIKARDVILRIDEEATKKVPYLFPEEHSRTCFDEGIEMRKRTLEIRAKILDKLLERFKRLLDTSPRILLEFEEEVLR